MPKMFKCEKDTLMVVGPHQTAISKGKTTKTPEGLGFSGSIEYINPGSMTPYIEISRKGIAPTTQDVVNKVFNRLDDEILVGISRNSVLILQDIKNRELDPIDLANLARRVADICEYEYESINLVILGEVF